MPGSPLWLAARIAPRLGVFAVMAVIGGATTVAGAGLLRPSVAALSTARQAPGVQLATSPDSPAGGAPIGFSITDIPGSAPIPTLAPADLAAAAQPAPGPASWLNTSGFPRVRPISQFDGGPFQNANCTLAAGAMLARLGFGIVTTGSRLRPLQDDQAGGTGLDDLAQAIARGHGQRIAWGAISPRQLRALLGAGYGAVVQGVYARVPDRLSLQPGFRGAHAIYVDAYGVGDGGSPGAYYVLDPLARPRAAYEGEWWPADVLEDFGLSFTRSGRILAAWAFPPGGGPPDVTVPDEPPLPRPGDPPDPGAAPPTLQEPGDEPPDEPAPDRSIDGGGTEGGHDLAPGVDLCLIAPVPRSCPPGIPGTFPGGLDVPPGPVATSPVVTLRFVDAARPNLVLVGFSVEPDASATIEYWEATRVAELQTASSIRRSLLIGDVQVAQLAVRASTSYLFVVIARSDRGATGRSQVGSFRTGDGVVRFTAELFTARASPFGTDLSVAPYTRLAVGGLAQPLQPADAGCVDVARIGDRSFCLPTFDRPAVGAIDCTRARVTYELVGINGTATIVRAYPASRALTDDGRTTQRVVLEATGPPRFGTIDIGCLTLGLDYRVALLVEGSDRGVLASIALSVPAS